MKGFLLETNARKLRNEGIVIALMGLVDDGIMTLQEAVRRTDLTEEQFVRIYKDICSDLDKSNVYSEQADTGNIPAESSGYVENSRIKLNNAHDLVEKFEELGENAIGDGKHYRI